MRLLVLAVALVCALALALALGAHQVGAAGVEVASVAGASGGASESIVSAMNAGDSAATVAQIKARGGGHHDDDDDDCPRLPCGILAEPNCVRICSEEEGGHHGRHGNWHCNRRRCNCVTTTPEPISWLLPLLMFLTGIGLFMASYWGSGRRRLDY